MSVSRFVLVGVLSLFSLQAIASNQSKEDLKNWFVVGTSQFSGKTEAQIVEILMHQFHLDNAVRLTCKQAAQMILGESVETNLEGCSASLISVGKIYLARALEKTDKVNRVKDIPTLARLLNIKKAIADIEA